MKRYHNIITLLLVFLSLIGFVSCKDDTNSFGESEGRLVLGMNVSMPQLDGMTQSEQEEGTTLLEDSCRVRIYNNEGLIRYYKGLSNVPSELMLATGDYRIQAITGDSVPATFKMGYYKGESNFTIEANSSTSINVTCKLKSTLVTISLTDSLKQKLTDYKITVSTPKGSLVYTDAHVDSIGYFILPEGCNELNWTIEGTQTDGSVYTGDGVISDVKPAMRYNLVFSYNETEYNQGGAYFNLRVDETTVEKLSNIVIYKRPSITGLDFDITRPVVFEENSGEALAVYINASSALTHVIVSCDDPTTMKLPANSIDFVETGDWNKSQWATAGISYLYEYDSENDISMAKITIAESLIKNLPQGTHILSIRAVDKNEKESEEDLNITISNAVVLTESLIRTEIWAKRATLRGSVLKETSEALSFQYRIKGGSTWESVSATRSGDILTASISGLTPGKTYEYRAVSGTTPSAITLEFTTESAFVLPNASFENWHQDGKVMLVYASGGEMWWDTGNHGSATLNKNITTQDTEYKNSGNSSVKMKSQFVGIGTVGKFAAGNIFAGVYAGTDGMDGIIDMGRSISSRPSKLTGYYKYITGEVDYSSTDLLPKGATDIGSIFVAIGDWDGPVTIKTKESERTLFDPNDTHVIAYGELNQTTNTSGDGLIPFTIDLEYRDNNRIPTYILIVASASKYGDYFTGSSASTMWLDDLELVYE